MLLAVDIGNTQTVIGLFEKASLVHDFRIESSKGRSRDEYHLLLRSLLEVAEVEREEVDHTIVASVVPALTDTVSEAIELAFGHVPLTVGPGIKTGMPILYDNPREVGADRIVNAVAAYERAKGPVIVVDFGTATTFDVVSAQGEYRGGVIAPGIRISAEALFARAAKLPRVEIARPPRVVGKSTEQSMQAGIIFGYVGLVDGIVERIRAEQDSEAKVIATGGLARVVAQESRTIEDVEEFLTLDGLRILYERNR